MMWYFVLAVNGFLIKWRAEVAATELRAFLVLMRGRRAEWTVKCGLFRAKKGPEGPLRFQEEEKTFA
jgi:hypothetical protein